MATIGQQLTAPESGWKRYEDDYPTIKYIGTWLKNNTADHISSVSGDKIKFDFIGTKLRILVCAANNRSDMSISIDGAEPATFTAYTIGVATRNALAYELTDIPYGRHTVEITHLHTQTYATLDAIDIDDTGRLLHPDEVTDPKDLAVGKRIRCHYSAPVSGQVGTFSNLGQETYKDGINDFIPPVSSATPDGNFYFIMVEDWNGKKRLIADRNIQHSISWDTLNTEGIATGDGLPTIIGTIPAMTSDKSNDGIIITQDAVNDSYPDYGWKAFDGIGVANSNRNFWYTGAKISPVGGHWVKINYPNSVRITKLSLRGFVVSGSYYSIKDFVFYGSNDDVTYTEIFRGTHPNGTTDAIVYEFDNQTPYKYYRINILNSYYSANNVGILEAQLYKWLDCDLAIRLLTGGISSTDKDNEWDKYIVNSTLNGTITAGDNNVWNWSQLRSWTSTTPTNGAGYRTCRGRDNVGYFYSTNASSGSWNIVGFRPVLLIESLYTPTMKYLFEDNGEVKKYVKHNPYALSFNGIDSYVSLHSLLTGFTTFTFEAWIKTTQNTSAANRWNNPAIFGTVQSAGDSQDFFISNYNGKLAWYDELGGGFYDTGALIADGTWKHIAVVRNGGTVTFYVNGNQVGSRTISATKTTSKQLEIGRAYYSGSMYFNGLIDEVRLWNTARTLSEIQSHMNKSLSGTELGLIGYWKFDEGSGTTAIDKTANANNGTINGATWTTDTPNTSENQWKSIGTAPVTESMFLTDGMDDLSIIDDNALQQLESDTPKLLMYTDDSNKTSATANLTAIPNGQLIFQEGDMDVSGGIESINITGSNIKIIASTDSGTTWKFFDGASWQSIEANAASVKENGMTPEVINGITKEQWKDLLGDSTTLRFAYYLEQNDITDTVNVDSITITPLPYATETPTLDSVKITYDELSIEGRMQDLERINANNMAKLQFKSNALLHSERYELHDLVIDTFESLDGIDTTNTTAKYDSNNKVFLYDTSTGAPSIQEVVLQEEILPEYRKKWMLYVEHEGNIDYEYSLDNGTTWSPIIPFTMMDLTQQTGINLKVKAKLKDSTAKLRGIAFSWA